MLRKQMLPFLITLWMVNSCNNKNNIENTETNDTTIITPSVTNYYKPTEITNEDLLADFCYPVSKFSNNYVGNGTCVLFEKSGSLIIISNNSVLNGIDFNKKGNVNNKIQIVYNTIEGNKNIIPISTNIDTQYIKKLKLEKDTDLVKMPIPFIPYDGKFSFVSNIIDTTYFNKIPMEIVCVGYKWETIYNNQKELKNIKYSLIKGKYIPYEDYLGKIVNLKRANPIKKGKAVNPQMSKRYFCLNSTLYDGMSGSPVFGKYMVNNNGINETVYKFIGLVCAFDSSAQMSLVIKAKNIQDVINH